MQLTVRAKLRSAVELAHSAGLHLLSLIAVPGTSSPSRSTKLPAPPRKKRSRGMRGVAILRKLIRAYKSLSWSLARTGSASALLACRALK